MPRRMQRPGMMKPGMARPNIARNANIPRNPKRGGKPFMASAVPGVLTNPGRVARQTGALPAGAKSRNTFWTRIPVVGGLMNLIAGLLFPKAHLRVMERKRVGTGLSVIRDRALQSRRSNLPVTKNHAKILRNRTPGLTQVKASQHAKGRIPGVLKYPGQRKAA